MCVIRIPPGRIYIILVNSKCFHCFFSTLINDFFPNSTVDIEFKRIGDKRNISISIIEKQKSPTKPKKTSTRETPVKNKKISPKKIKNDQKGPKLVYIMFPQDIRGNTTEYQLNKYQKFIFSELDKVLKSQVQYDIVTQETYPMKYILTVYRGKKSVKTINNLITKFSDNIDGSDKLTFPLDIEGTEDNADYSN